MRTRPLTCRETWKKVARTVAVVEHARIQTLGMTRMNQSCRRTVRVGDKSAVTVIELLPVQASAQRACLGSELTVKTKDEFEVSAYKGPQS